MDAQAVLPVAASVFDSSAPQLPVPVTNLGIPWMKNDSDSAGQGKNHGFGSGKKGGMGDDEGPGAGQGEAYNGPYANVASLPVARTATILSTPTKRAKPNCRER